MSFDVDIGHASATGPRDVNEDFAGAVRTPRERAAQGVIAAVADGVSAGGRGLEAAQTTVIALLDDFFATPQTWAATTAMDRLIGAQNAWLAKHNRGAESGAALTTLTALAIQGQTFTVGHVGDTRAWLLRDAADAELQRLTQDHAFEHPDQRSRLTRAVGLDDHLRPDYDEGEVRPGDRFVLTSDGVHGVLKPRRIAALLREAADAQAASDAIVAAALAAGTHDNATALVLRITGLDVRSLRDELGAASRLPVPAALRVGETIDGFTVTALVADTGVHRLYQARRGDAKRTLVALKTLHPSRAHDPEERAMLAHEAWLGQRLADAAGFVRVHDRAADASAFYSVFDWHQGRTVEQLMAGGTKPAVADVVDCAIAAAKALGRLHRLGVVHRDIKPGNLHRDDDGAWRILDLGVAVSGRESAAQRELHAGTPSYMNPEQWAEGGVADTQSDLYALGATLYQWLTGRLPYGEIEPYQTGRFRRDPPSPARLRPDVPIWLDHVLRRAVARDPVERFETAEELLLALERGASRPLAPPSPTPLITRDEALLWKIALTVSLLFNALLIVWLLFLPR
jgi:serine/threonine protein phosphatase PrpC